MPESYIQVSKIQGPPLSDTIQALALPNTNPMIVNWLAVVIASVAQFIIGAIWYMPIFGKMWGKLHDFNPKTPEEASVMTKQMMPLLVVQFLVTVVTTIVLAIFIGWIPTNWNAYAMAGFLWIGFVVPTQVSAVLFGGTKPERVVKKIAIMAGGSLICLEAAAAIIKAML